MRRVHRLFDSVTSFEGLCHAARLALRGSRSAEGCSFLVDLEPNVLALQSALRSGEYRPGAYRSFLIHEPKVRLISAAPFVDRVVHHSVCHHLEPMFERFSIYDSYACRTGKGLHRAVLRAQRFSRRWPAFLKLDIKHFFESADHEVLRRQLRYKVKDPRLLSLCDVIIGSNAPGSDLGKGLPIGNLTSQFFANYYLSFLDRWVKQSLRVKGYVRYMDDFVLWGDSLDGLMRLRDQVRVFVEDELRVSLKESAQRCDWVASGVPFLGVRVFPFHVRLDGVQKRRALRRFKALMAEVSLLADLGRRVTYEERVHLDQRWAALSGWMAVADSQALFRSWADRWGWFSDGFEV